MSIAWPWPIVDQRVQARLDEPTNAASTTRPGVIPVRSMSLMTIVTRVPNSEVDDMLAMLRDDVDWLIMSKRARFSGSVEIQSAEYPTSAAAVTFHIMRAT